MGKNLKNMGEKRGGGGGERVKSDSGKAALAVGKKRQKDKKIRAGFGKKKKKIKRIRFGAGGKRKLYLKKKKSGLVAEK